MSTLKLNGITSGSSVLKAPDTGSSGVTFTLPASTGTLLTTDGDGSSLTGVGVDGISSSADATCLTIDSSENITHNSATPKFTIKGTAGEYGLYFKQGNTEYSSLTWDVETGETKLSNGQNGTGNYLTFAAGDGSERMRIDSSGKVGIGTSSPSAPLHVNGGGGVIRFGTHTTALSEISHDTYSDAYTIYNNKDSAGHSFKVNGIEKFRIYNDGRGVSEFTGFATAQLVSLSSTPTINHSHNVSSVTDVSTGRYKCNFTNSTGGNRPSFVVMGQNRTNYDEIFYADIDSSSSTAMQGGCTRSSASASWHDCYKMNFIAFKNL